MAQPNYIEIGQVCQAFQETTPPTISSVYFVSSGNNLLKNTSRTAPAYFSATAPSTGGPIVNYADYKFKVWYDAILARSGTTQNEQFWRRLTSDATNVAPTDQSDVGSVIKAGSSWPASTGTVDGFSTTYGSTPTTYTMNKTTNSNFETLIAGLLQYPMSVTNSSTAFYLKDTTVGSTRYLTYSGGNFSTIDAGSITFTQSSVTQFYLGTHTVPGVSKELGINTSSNPTSKLTNSQINSDYTVTITNIGTFLITTTPPLQQLIIPGALPSTITMIKSITGKYLFWNGSYGNGSMFTLKDYWADSLTTTDIKRGIQFYFVDLTTQNANSPTGGSVDFYRWNVIDNTAVPTTITNTANVTVSGSSIQATQTAVPTAPAEGWTFNATGASGPPFHLVYVRESSAGSGVLNPVAYANIAAGGSTVSVVPISAIADLTSTSGAIASKSWYCIKCSSTSIDATTGICQVSPAPEPI